EQLENAINVRTKLFMFSSPNNPTGAVYSKAELAGLAEVFRKHPDVWIMSDEIYEYINYVGKHESIAQFEDLRDRVIIVNGLSKGFAMTGYRLGYIACANTDLVKACDKIQGQITSGANAATQQGAVAALNEDIAPSMQMQAEFAERKQLVLQMLSEIPGLKLSEPDGAFYVFPDVSSYFGKKAGDRVIANADDLAMYLLEQAHVSTVTGSAFGEPRCIRISYAASRQDLKKGFSRIREALAVLQ
ncbi:MAG TPA: aminotransferase class I/II-fold pyridoxal phosphate-dependent enzyme, partial [Phnomibacter sp.]|nr:aminotransferase class I/II-fold pyridoxal phosphate-dependent enzyme [Phnomibacter sp.]